MALNTLNTDAISFKRLSGKAHTQQGFSVTEESLPSNVSLSYTTIFADKIKPTPTGLTGITYPSDGVVERVMIPVEIIPDTLIGTNRSQGYRLKLPAGYVGNGGKLPFANGTILANTLGKAQIVPPLYGTVNPDGSTPYDPILYQTDGTTQITKFDPINWIIDFYSGVLFVQDPPAGYDISASRPGFVHAYLFVGSYLNELVSSGLTGTSVEWTSILNKPTEFPPAPHTHPISGVTGLQAALDSKIETSEIGQPNGVAPLNSEGIIPSIHLPSDIKEVFVVANLAARTARFVASGVTGTTGVTSFEGLRVFVLDAQPDFTGSTEYVDTTGFLAWSAITNSTQVVLDWTDITGKPQLVNRIYAGTGIGLSPTGGTGNTTVNVLIDGTYLETVGLNGNISIKDNSILPSKIAFEGNNSGTVGQFIVKGSGDTFQAITLLIPTGSTGVNSIVAGSGITNMGTLTDPILVAQGDGSDNTIVTGVNGLKVNDQSIGLLKLKLGSAADQLNAFLLPINTGSSYTQATDVGTAIEQLASGITQINGSSITGATTIGTGTTTILGGTTGNSIQFKSIKHGKYIALTDNGSTLNIAVTGISATTGNSGTIGPAEDGTYTDGLFPDFVPSTPVGTAVDRFNEVLKALAPTPAPDMNQMSGFGTFVSGKLSWGSSKALAGFTNVGTNAGNAAVDINGNYPISGTRLGLTAVPVTGILNDTTVGGPGNIPFADNAFSDGHKGKLVLTKNGVQISQLVLSGTTGATSNTYMSVTAVAAVKFPSGQPLNVFTYRTGTFTIPLSAMTNGYNYIRITHTDGTFSRVTNFLEWVYDNDASNITMLAGTTGLTSLSLSGTKNISGVKYHTSGTIGYQAGFNNVYKNVYSNSATAIDITAKENIGAITNLNITGLGTTGRTGSVLQSLPGLDIAATNPQNTDIAIAATLAIAPAGSVLLGNIGSLGRLRASVAVSHPFASQSYAGGQSTLTGFLLNAVTQVTDPKTENYNGEVDRLEARDYSVLTYANVNGGTYAWDSTQSLVGANSQHNTGLLVFNGELLYPNAAYLGSTYGITTGNFAGVTNTPAGNVNYTAASGIRSHYRKFKSANGSTQSTLTFAITHTGTNADFLTNGGTAGTPSGNNIKFEFLIMRSGGAIHGWANPFASSGNPEGIAVTSSSHSAGVTTVTCTLATTPRVALNDIVIVRIFTASGYTNRVLNLVVNNI